MDNINYVTMTIIRQCAEKNVHVTETLAAFVARARVLEAPQIYHMDKQLAEEDVGELIQVGRIRALVNAALNPPRVGLRGSTLRTRLAFAQDNPAAGKV